MLLKKTFNSSPWECSKSCSHWCPQKVFGLLFLPQAIDKLEHRCLAPSVSLISMQRWWSAPDSERFVHLGMWRPSCWQETLFLAGCSWGALFMEVTIKSGYHPKSNMLFWEWLPWLAPKWLPFFGEAFHLEELSSLLYEPASYRNEVSFFFRSSSFCLTNSLWFLKRKQESWECVCASVPTHPSSRSYLSESWFVLPLKRSVFHFCVSRLKVLIGTQAAIENQ